MRIAIGFSGPAGSGVNTSGLLLGQLLANKGYTILADKEYASIIKGDNNNFFLYVTDQENDHFITKTIDYFFAFDEFAINKNQKIYNFQQAFNIKEQIYSRANIFCFGAALKLMNIDIEEGIGLINKQFPGHTHEQNITDLKSGYAYMQGLGINGGNRNTTISTPKTLMFGNECIAKGAMDSGMDFYAAYPMTPASSLIDVISTDHRVTFFQGEDEIAVSMAMLGAKVGGKRAMCGTSGGGFALMTESIAFSNQAEIGGVIVLAQRDGPSTGTPTYTAQADLNYALNASFGDTFPIVIAPSTLEEGYTLIGKALNWSDIYQHPVIFLVDKQFSEGYIAIDPSKLKPEPINRGKLLDTNTITPEYKRYQFSQDGISPWTITGTKHGEFMATSYEHDEYGATNEDPEIKKQMEDKRATKLETFIQQEFTDQFYGYEIIHPEAKRFFVTFGWNRYVLEDYIKNKADSDIGLIIIKCLQPFDTRLKTFLETKYTQIQELTFVEMNRSGQLQDLVTKHCGLADSKRNSKIHHHRKYTLYPIFSEEIQ